MNRNIKALFFDIDGTLVSFRTHLIPQSTVEALQEAKRNGVAIYISTGRPLMIINNLGQIEHLIDVISLPMVLVALWEIIRFACDPSLGKMWMRLWLMPTAVIILSLW